MGLRQTASLGSRTLAYNRNPRRNEDPPILWASGALPPNPQQGTAPPAPPLYVWTVSPRGTPPRPPAYVGVPRVGIGVVGVAVDLKRRKDERRSTGRRGGRVAVDRESWRDEWRLAESGGRTSDGRPEEAGT